ncbi:MAG: XF1762 family protein [Lachnospiraceae bacterium]
MGKGGKYIEIRPITLKEAQKFVDGKHRHHKAPVGHKFSVGLFEGDTMVGCAICGRPVSRALDDKRTCEVSRLCTEGGKNACSMLYGACGRIAKAMGYRRIITYTLASESGVSLRASGFICEGIAGGEAWTGNRRRDNGVPKEKKRRWSRLLSKKK